jgi:hypothetical protein
MNVVISVKRGPIDEFMHVAGLNTTAWPQTSPQMKTVTIHYFVNLQTLEVRRDAMWTRKFSTLADSKYSLLCSTDTVIPQYGRYIALTTELSLKVVLLFSNSYLLNLFGIIEGIISKDKLCNGRKMNHYALDNCKYHPLSTYHLQDIWVRMDRSFDTLTFASFRYIGVLFGFDYGLQNWMKNVVVALKGPDSGYTNGIIRAVSRGIASGMSVVLTVTATSFYTLFFVVDEIILKYILQQLENTFNGAQKREYIFFAMSNLFFDSITSGTLKNGPLGSQYKICREYAEATGDVESPLGLVIFHTCVAVFEGMYAGMQVISSVVTLSALTECVCNIDPRTLNSKIDLFEEKCAYKLPATLRPELLMFMQNTKRQSNQCSILINQFRNVLLKIPSETILHMDRALVAASNVPLYIMKLLTIDRTDTTTCTEYDNSLEVVTIVPRPISFFKKCAFLPTCREKCIREIEWFEAEKNNVVTPNRAALQSALMAFIPAWTSKIAGLNEIFEPLAVQEYAGRGDQCNRYIVVIGRPLQSGSPGQALPWSMYFFCYTDSTLNIVLISQKVLETTTIFALPDDENHMEKYIVQELFLVPMDITTQGALVVVYLEKNSPTNTIFEVIVDSTGEVHNDWIVQSSSIKSNTDCNEISSSVGAHCHPKLDPSIPYTFLEEGKDASSASAYFHKIVILPGQQPATETLDDLAPYTIFAMYYTYIQYRVPGDTELYTCEAELEMRLVRTRNRNDETLRDKKCTMFPAKRTEIPKPMNTMWNLLSLLTKTRTEKVLLSFDADNMFLFGSKSLERISFGIDESNRVNYTIAQTYGVDTDSSGVGAIFSSKSQTSDYEERKVTKKIYRGIVMSHNKSLGSKIVYTILETDTIRKTDSDNWITQYIFSFRSISDANKFRLGNSDTPGPNLQVIKSSGLAVMLETKINVECNYMSCQSCNGRKLKNFCTMAQKCAMVNCVGTVVNPNNVFCVMGTIAKEYREIIIYKGNAIWFAAVEIGMSIMRISEIENVQREPIDLESISNILNTNMCENKDLAAVISAFFPALVMTIITSVIGNSQGFTFNDLGGGSGYILKQIFSPGVKLRYTSIISAVTQAIDQILLGYIMFYYRNTRYIMCALTRLAEFTGGYIRIVSHNIGDTDFCTIDTEFSEGMKARDDESIVRDRITSGAVGDAYTQMSVNGQRFPPSKFTFDSALTVGLVSSMEKIVLIVNMNSIVDFSLGILYALARLSGLVESEKCRPSSTDFAFVLSCACGDTPFRVDSSVRDDKMKQGSLWCTGIQKHVNMDGNIVFVYNPFSLQELSDDLHDAGIAYIQCITQNNNAQCIRERQRIYLSKFNKHFSVHDVSPLAVLTRCRENFNTKTWDEGTFAAFNTELIDHVVDEKEEISARDMEIIQNDISIYLSEDANGPVHSCLRNGPTKNRIQACMILAFAHSNYQNQAEFAEQLANGDFMPSTETSIYEYFKYTQVTDPAMTRHCDACEFLSSETFSSNAEVRKCQLQDDIGGFCGDESANECKISMTTLAYEQSIQRNIVELFRVSSPHIIDKDTMDRQVDLKYTKIKECAESFFNSVDLELSENVINSIIDKLDLNLITGEGDLLHQHMDCIFMGAYDRVFFAPTDSEMVLEPLMYSRNKSGASREFELPCAGSMVYDRYAENVVDSGFLQKTCGTETRIGVMAYVKKNIVSSANALNVMLAAKIREKIQNIRTNFTDISRYGCQAGSSYRGCCAVYGKCLPTESTFEPSIPEINFEISGSELLLMLMQSVSTIQKDILYNVSVRFMLFCKSQLFVSHHTFRNRLKHGILAIVFLRRHIFKKLVECLLAAYSQGFGRARFQRVENE